MAKGSGNLIRKFDKIDYDPFSEEFDSDEIVNRGEGIDALSTPEQEEKTDKKEVKPEQIFSDEDLAEMAQKGEEGKDAVELYKKFAGDEKEESSIIKEDEIHEHRIDSLYSEEFSPEPPDKEELNEILERDEDKKEKSTETDKEDDDEYLYFRDKNGRKVKRSKEFLKKQKDYEEKLIASLYGPDYSETDEFRDMILLKNKFNEIFKADKLKPVAKFSSGRNLLQSDEIDKDKKFIEVTEAPSFKGGEPHGVSTVEINRNKGGEIESIIVQCKCGEETVIEFDYSDEENDELTVIDKEESTDKENNSDDQKPGRQEEPDEEIAENTGEEKEEDTENESLQEGMNHEELQDGSEEEGDEELDQTDIDEDKDETPDDETDKKFEDMFPDENKDESEE